MHQKERQEDGPEPYRQQHNWQHKYVNDIDYFRQNHSCHLIPGIFHVHFWPKSVFCNIFKIPVKQPIKCICKINKRHVKVLKTMKTQIRTVIGNEKKR